MAVFHEYTANHWEPIEIKHTEIRRSVLKVELHLGNNESTDVTKCG